MIKALAWGQNDIGACSQKVKNVEGTAMLRVRSPVDGGLNSLGRRKNDVGSSLEDGLGRGSVKSRCEALARNEDIIDTTGH
jgi:hypothetical protein